MTSVSDQASQPGALPELPGVPVILDQIDDCFLAVDTKWQITYLNAAAAEVLHRTDLVGEHLWAAFPSAEESEFGQAYRKAFDTQEPVFLEAVSPFSNRRFVSRVYPSAAGLSIYLRNVTETRAAQQQLEESEQRFRSLYEQNAEAVLMYDLDGRVTAANTACSSLFGYTQEDLLGQSFLDFIVSEDQARIAALFTQVRSGMAKQTELIVLHKNGKRVSVSASSSPMYVNGTVTGVYGIAKDQTRQKQVEAALVESEQWMQTLVDSSPCALVLTRWHDGAFLYTNRLLRELFGFSSEEEALRHFAAEFYVHPPDRATLLEGIANQDKVYVWEGHYRNLKGTQFWLTGAYKCMVYKSEQVLLSAFQDMTEARRCLEEAWHEADHDPLTGLLNHRAFHNQLDALAALAEAEGQNLAVVMLDLDNFKFFNDAYGHGVGDEVLCQVAERLRTVCRPTDVLARFGGDEFALLLPDTEEKSAEEINARLAADLGGISFKPPSYETEVPISLSLGTALFPRDAQSRQEAMQIADERLRQAKSGVEAGEAQPLRAALRGEVQGFSMLDALVTAVDAKDRYTRRHSEDVMHYGLQIARALGMNDEALHTVAVSALLHDVGKIGVPDAVLRKPSRLTAEEFDAIKLHPNIGAVIVAAVPGLENTLEAVRHHHERWDGGGYPDGLRGEETPLLARLMAVADAYSAMTTDRPYRRGMDPDRARTILEEGAGTQWDPACVRAFMKTQP